MAQRVRIQCINKAPRNDPYHHITNIGGVNGDGSRWKMTEQAAIDGIHAGRYEFYVTVNGLTVDVVIARSRHGHEYLKTKPDGERPDNLLSLPECP